MENLVLITPQTWEVISGIMGLSLKEFACSFVQWSDFEDFETSE